MDEKIATKIDYALRDKRVKETVDEYSQSRLTYLFSELEKAIEPSRIYQLQGAISEIRKLLDVRETALKVLENNRWKKSERLKESSEGTTVKSASF